MSAHLSVCVMTVKFTGRFTDFFRISASLLHSNALPGRHIFRVSNDIKE